MKNGRLFSVLGLTSFLAVASCGGSSDGGGSCSNTAPCGGDIVGSWTIQSSCVSADTSMDSMVGDCAGATVGASSLSITGTAVYNADMTYTMNGFINGSTTVNIPSSCLSFGGQSVTCADLNALFASQPQAGYTISCTGTSTCTCVQTAKNVASNDSGTYTTTAAGLLTLTNSDGDVEQDDYCVKGTTLTLSTHPDATMMGGSVKGTITLVKK